MTTYAEIMSQAQSLMAQAEKIRTEARASVIASILDQMREHGLTVNDLRSASRKPAASKSPARYRGPNGELWAGGPGRKPAWVKAALEAGQSLDQYLINYNKEAA